MNELEQKATARKYADEYRLNRNKQFSAWEHKEKNGVINHGKEIFIRDGVISPEQWFSQKVRPLFLLKEAYTKNETENWDLIDDYLAKNDVGLSHIWKRVSLWIHGIMGYVNENKVPVYTKMLDMNYLKRECLQKTAVVNVKKSGGKTRSDDENIMQYAIYDSKEIIKQLELCDPTVIICGNTGEALKYIMYNERGQSLLQKNEFERDNFVYHMNLNNHDVLVINFWHPSNHFPDIMNYYSLMSIFANAYIE